LTHNDLIPIAEKWLLSHGCGFALKELSTSGFEIPDCVGWSAMFSFLIECKATHSDFLADSKKVFRKRPELGIGDFRFYMCPSNLILPQELPKKWGLIYVNEKGKARKIVGGRGNIHSNWREWQFTEVNKRAEQAMMYSALRRMQLQGKLSGIYSWRKGN